jgi:hypothetical protein
MPIEGRNFFSDFLLQNPVATDTIIIIIPMAMAEIVQFYNRRRYTTFIVL